MYYLSDFRAKLSSVILSVSYQFLMSYKQNVKHFVCAHTRGFDPV